MMPLTLSDFMSVRRYDADDDEAAARR